MGALHPGVGARSSISPELKMTVLLPIVEVPKEPVQPYDLFETVPVAVVPVSCASMGKTHLAYTTPGAWLLSDVGEEVLSSAATVDGVQSWCQVQRLKEMLGQEAGTWMPARRTSGLPYHEIEDDASGALWASCLANGDEGGGLAGPEPEPECMPSTPMAPRPLHAPPGLPYGASTATSIPRLPMDAKSALAPPGLTLLPEPPGLLAATPNAKTMPALEESRPMPAKLRRALLLFRPCSRSPPQQSSSSPQVHFYAQTQSPKTLVTAANWLRGLRPICFLKVPEGGWTAPTNPCASAALSLEQVGAYPSDESSIMTQRVEVEGTMYRQWLCNNAESHETWSASKRSTTSKARTTGKKTAARKWVPVRAT